MRPNQGTAFVVALLAGAGLLEGASAAGPARRYRKGELVVKFTSRPALGDLGRLAPAGEVRIRVVRGLGRPGDPGTALLRFPESASVERMAALVRGLPNVVWAEPNYLGRIPTAARGVSRNNEPPYSMADAPFPASLQAAAAPISPAAGGWSPTDPDFALNYPYYIMNYLAVYPAKAPSPMVAIVGTGVDALHPDLAGRVVKGTDWVNGDADPEDDNGYGTHEAGIVAAAINNGKGALGLSNGKVLVIKVIDAQGWWTAFDVASGINQAAANPLVKVIYFSGWTGQDLAVIRDAVETAVDKGKLLVFPAGDDVGTPQYPAYYSDLASFPSLAPSVISVTASGLSQPSMWTGGVQYGCLPSWANADAWISMFAPGVAVYAPTPTRAFHLNDQDDVPFGYAYLDGSSEAAAEVAAVAARAWSVMPAGTTASEVKDRVVTTGWRPVANPKATMIDTDGDTTTDTLCHPAAMNDNALHVEVAAAMGLHQIIGRAFDAHTAAPINKTGVVFGAYLNGKPQGFGGAFQEGWFSVLAVPTDNTTPYDLRLNVPGYTAGAVSFLSMMVTDCGGGSNTHNCVQPSAGGIGLPRNLPGQYHVVTNWDMLTVETHLFTPTAGPIQCNVGVTPLSSLYCGLGSLTAAPFARILYHGSTDGTIPWARGNNLVSIKGPLYPTSPGLPYEIFIRNVANHSALLWQGARTRVWSAGKILGMVDASEGDRTTNGCSIGGGANDCDVFYVGDLSQAGVFTPKGIYGTSSALGPPGVIPYSAFPRPSRRRP